MTLLRLLLIRISSARLSFLYTDDFVDLLFASNHFVIVCVPLVHWFITYIKLETGWQQEEAKTQEFPKLHLRILVVRNL